MKQAIMMDYAKVFGGCLLALGLSFEQSNVTFVSRGGTS